MGQATCRRRPDYPGTCHQPPASGLVVTMSLRGVCWKGLSEQRYARPMDRLTPVLSCRRPPTRESISSRNCGIAFCPRARFGSCTLGRGPREGSSSKAREKTCWTVLPPWASARAQPVKSTSTIITPHRGFTWPLDDKLRVPDYSTSRTRPATWGARSTYRGIKPASILR